MRRIRNPSHWYKNLSKYNWTPSLYKEMYTKWIWPHKILYNRSPCITEAIESLAQACKGASMDLGQRPVARAHSGLAYAKAFGLGLEKALVSAKFGPPFKPKAPAPSSDLGQGSPKCPSCLRKRAFAPTPCTIGTPRMEATTSTVAEISFPAKTHSSQGKPSFPSNSSRGEHSSSFTPF